MFGTQNINLQGRKIFHQVFLLFWHCFIVFLLLQSCSKSSTPLPDSGRVVIHFTHYCDGRPVKLDTLAYTNAAGNRYMVNEIQYFISDLKFRKTSGDYQLVSRIKDYHYIDSHIPSTWTWKVADAIEPGEYNGISFIFGFTAEKNYSFRFVNPPERDMFWPEILGGGYHYLKLNGKWVNLSQDLLPFNFHLGIGQIYAGGVVHPDSIIGYVQNFFEVQLPSSPFTINAGDTLYFEIRMNIENWFRNPHVYDHNIWGGHIMQNQEAMKIGCENGKEDVFSFHPVLRYSSQKSKLP